MIIDDEGIQIIWITFNINIFSISIWIEITSKRDLQYPVLVNYFIVSKLHFSWSCHMGHSIHEVPTHSQVYVAIKSTIEGLRDAVHTYTRMILPRSLGFLFVQCGMEKQTTTATKHAVILDLLHNRILNITQVCVCKYFCHSVL